ncbi:MAG: DUF433 domain-containing protein [Nanoarchaeota archaeon]|nr:DUF433 domain-containing protein [Nanoarchaeota archaeon]MBU1051367.1 DUF433 domain-containing protein [Nanoarchaeota archaeon]MBU1988382.1 DUF433 domain-containing protein [Nanoarchaeota archaeon]
MIVSEEGYYNGEPRIKGNRITVANVVANVSEMGLEEYCSDFDLARDNVLGAIDYCAGQRCEEGVVNYCT